MTKKISFPSLYPAEVITLAYALLTMIVIVIMGKSMHSPVQMFVERAAMSVGILLLAVCYSYKPSRWFDFVRYAYVVLLLPYWYSDTFEFNRFLPNLDHLFAHWEQVIFGCQPALRFGEAINHILFSEAINMGYFFLYPMFAIFSFITFFCYPRKYDKWIFTLLFTFYCYYVLFLFIPVVGPQFYFPAIGWDVAREAIFTPVGTYFDTHPDMLPNEPVRGIFSWIVHQTHLLGERPTGAFPSSHVGMSTVVMIAAWKYCKRFFWIVMPIYLLLVMATVYIKAHYLIDSLAGFVLAFVFYSISSRIYKKFPHPKSMIQ